MGRGYEKVIRDTGGDGNHGEPLDIPFLFK